MTFPNFFCTKFEIFLVNYFMHSFNYNFLLIVIIFKIYYDLICNSHKLTKKKTKENPLL